MATSTCCMRPSQQWAPANQRWQELAGSVPGLQQVGGTCGTGVGACAVPCTVNTAGGRAVGTSGIDDTGTEAAGGAAVGTSGTDTGCGAVRTSSTDTCTEAAGSGCGAGGTSGTDTCTCFWRRRHLTGTEAEGTSGTEHIGGGAAAGGVVVGCTGDAVPAVEPSVSPGSESVSYANKWHENYRV